MHLHFERNTNAKCDCSIVSLSWMGKVPDNVPEVNNSFLITISSLRLENVPQLIKSTQKISRKKYFITTNIYTVQKLFTLTSDHRQI